MSPREQMVVGNWKLNGSRHQNAMLLKALLEGVGRRSTAVGVCVPHPYLAQAQEQLSGSPVFWAAQDVSDQESGAFTGQVSASMLKDFCCSMTLVGHSERRRLNGESNSLVAAKAVRALAADVRPIVCVGETLDEHLAGNTESVVRLQLEAVLERVETASIGQMVLAYEPVWAIGTGRSATPDQAQDVHAFLREVLAQRDRAVAERVTILYGGSVKPDNAQELFGMPDIDGGLIGGASLKASDFLAIVAAMDAVSPSLG